MISQREAEDRIKKHHERTSGMNSKALMEHGGLKYVEVVLYHWQGGTKEKNYQDAIKIIDDKFEYSVTYRK